MRRPERGQVGDRRARDHMPARHAKERCEPVYDAPLQPGPYVGPLAQNVSAAHDVTALIILLGAHHLDLMFMDDDDPPCARFAREFEVAAVKRWTGLA